MTTVLHGVDQSVATFDDLPDKGHWCAKCVTEDLQAPFVWDEDAAIWVPDGIIVFEYDFATHGGAQGAIDLGIDVPADILIVDGMINVVTSLDSGGAATLALHIEGAGDVLAATAYGSLAAGLVDVVPDNTAANAILTTDTQAITATIATADLTAGKLYGHLRCHRTFS
jgi:hypothetical protein